LLSGSGRTLTNLLSHIDAGKLHAQVVLVIASRPCAGAEIARWRSIPTTIEAGDIPADRLGEVLSSAGAQWVVLAGYLRRIAIPRGYENRIVNIHPALLPAFGGPGMYGLKVHEAVVNAGVNQSGCTVHLCDAEYDRGPIILQERCDVRADDTPQTLADRVFELEKAAYPKALELLISGRVEVGAGRAGRPSGRPEAHG
jgi:folate-dependent phosphoribosylglycinamide formyltransferase PurN